MYPEHERQREQVRLGSAGVRVRPKPKDPLGAVGRRAFKESLFNIRFTLKERPLDHSDLADFIRCYNAENRHDRQETGRFHRFAYEELIQRDKANLDVFWLRDNSLENSPPDALAQEIVEDLEAALEVFSGISEALR